MESDSLKHKATKGVLWSALDKFATQSGQFIIGILLARLLMPEDFGMIGMLYIFITISQSFIDSGMGSGLIQKKDKSSLDYSTVFVFNFIVSVIFYLILFFLAPFIANFYRMPQLNLLTKVLCLNIIINSLSVVQRAKLTINIDFKTIAKVNVIAILSSGLIAVYLAYNGRGVWALVAQNLVTATLTTALLWWLTKWAPSFRFSRESFQTLFGFGSKILLTGLYSQTINEIYNVVIGKTYSASHLGFYTNSKKLAEVSAGTVTTVLQQVTFPILASLQTNKDRLVSVYRRLIRMTSFFIFPIMTLLALLADPLISLLLTDKWAPSIVLLQWMCFARIITPISGINMNILNAVGRSDLFLKVDLSKFPMIVLALVITIPMGVKAIVIGHVVTSGISFFINAYMPGKLFGYGATEQLKDMIPTVLYTALMAFVVFLVIHSVDDLLLKIILGGSVGIVSYLGASYLGKVPEVEELKSIIRVRK